MEKKKNIYIQYINAIMLARCVTFNKNNQEKILINRVMELRDIGSQPRKNTEHAIICIYIYLYVYIYVCIYIQSGSLGSHVLEHSTSLNT